ncbi:hypothetical protein [Burkholderia guangdongensis]|uniref:hypothetical protein n=1 Tax=Burkholderia guangdongensis TaxID=1792500 RepID=UPI0015C7B754|nr:hypothetical protein [Burkholderia guangdongensis]
MRDAQRVVKRWKGGNVSDVKRPKNTRSARWRVGRVLSAIEQDRHDPAEQEQRDVPLTDDAEPLAARVERIA